MFERLAALKARYEELNGLIGEASVVANQELWRKLVKEHGALEPIVELYDQYLAAVSEMEDCRELMKNPDRELAEFAETEYYATRDRRDDLTGKLKLALLPKDPNDDKNVIIEIRGGAGGEEAGLFAAEIRRMYFRFAERARWTIEDIDSNITELGGVKESTFMVKGKGAYSKLKYESGVHRVQRVPETESQGRVHTSTITVAVLPEAEEVDLELNEKDFREDTYRSSGAGGQHVNKTDSAIRLTHIPTGIVVACQDERSQIKNREKAWTVMRSRLYDYYQTQKDKEYAENRRTQVGTGDRSERIRTYNYPQGRVTDHRIGMTLYSLPAFLDGDMSEMLEALAIAAQNARLSKTTD